MHQSYIDAGWPRQVVRVIDTPNWAQLETGLTAWLWLNGAHSTELESEVQALTGPFSLYWVWRGTPREYEPPGYRRGPMLLPLSAPLLEKFISAWGPEQAGLILVGPAEPQPLLQHIQALDHFTGSDGQPIAFRLDALRTLEEICEALPSEQLARVFGPIQSLIWHAGQNVDEWLRIRTPVTASGDLQDGQQIALTGSDEAALNLASRAWFMRDFACLMTRRFPVFSTKEDQLRLRRQLTIFVDEANSFGFSLERDLRFYMELRLRYTQKAFVEDRLIQDLLRQTSIQGLQRLFDISDRLSQTSVTSI
ncbi:hypothetical protein [Cupriavidus sp. WS]|uniref:hypothetical protein n=1 Tax=Cupriavidus sp. WS TaxID=1312922 RepID=UPI0003658A6F|nr:hypothetical protein [Cupriavidus sp. WS]